ncbi:AEC family transporter [Cuneatibacter caecimuris]|uniref:AEC family transporter n=1 Tax=Cuneatibacter caecimuris TaxID=1796618 RepID=A0A4Q7PKI1_9FIRM|nr:AEC family transporter [Cuneatibacter caecimuris]RZT01244.1 hypothetical protein EV209_1688 [Cuneatibacter caecimuris]
METAVVFQQMLILFIILAVGYIANKTGIIPTASNKTLSGIVLNIANPALVIASVSGDHSKISGRGLAVTLLISICMFAALIAIAFVIPKILRAEREDEKIYNVMIVFSNIGFMGMPLVSALMGAEALLYVAIFTLPFNFLIYTYGVQLMCAGTGKKAERFSVKKVLNIGTISCVAAIILFFADIRLPEVLATACSTVGGLTAPLSMLVIGVSIASMDLKSTLKDKKLWLFSFIKLMALPALGYCILRICVNDDYLVQLAGILFCTPVGSMVAMLAEQYTGKCELAAKGVAMTTLLSVVTIPVMLALMTMFS